MQKLMPYVSPRNSETSSYKPFAKQLPLILLALILGHFHGLLHFHSGRQKNHRRSSCPSTPSPIDDDAWTTIQVFRGLGESRPSEILWHSQARQDELVFALLRNKTNGYFVDLAANDAIQLSNTYSLERDWGWKGVCIEPNPIYWWNLSTFRSCAKIGAVVGRSRMEEVYFRFEAGDHGGIAGEGFDNGRRWQSRSQRRFTVSLEEILEDRVKAPAVMDYLSLDVEGAETFIMQNFPFSRYRFRVITAERLRGEIRGTLKSHGYEFIQQLSHWGESLWIHNDHRDEMDLSVVSMFSFPV